jgi:hypothetical protein
MSGWHSFSFTMLSVGDGSSKPCIPSHSPSLHQALCYRSASSKCGTAVIIGELGMDVGCPVGIARTMVDRPNAHHQFDISALTRRHPALIPGVKAALGNLQQSAHDPYRMGGLVRLHESEERFGVAGFSFAIQAAAFDKISRSSVSRRFSRRRRVSSSRSLVVGPPSPRPSSPAARLTHWRID